jgi:hypothetical protein
MEHMFVTLEIAKQLKELGYNEPCLACNTFYSDENHLEVLSDYYNISNQLRGLKFVTNELFDSIKEKELSGELFVLQNAIALPTWEDVKIWFETKFNLSVIIEPFKISTGTKSGHRYTYRIVDLDNYFWKENFEEFSKNQKLFDLIIINQELDDDLILDYKENFEKNLPDILSYQNLKLTTIIDLFNLSISHHKEFLEKENKNSEDPNYERYLVRNINANRKLFQNTKDKFNDFIKLIK